MAKTQRITGNLTVDPTGNFIVLADTEITGNLTVTGTTTTVTTTNTAISDRQIVLNDGESGAGVTGRYSGLEVERGSTSNSWLVFDENDDKWKISYDGGSTFSTIATSISGGSEVVDDTSPQLGGDLEVNGFNIVSANSNEDIQLVPSGTGRIAMYGPIKLNDQGGTPGSATNATVLYADTASGGGTGLFFVDGSTSDELVSKSKAIVYGLIF
jgi:hypothetical protein